jgi:hypothetical protein
MKTIDMVGQQFGRWLVLEEAGRRNGKRLYRCECQCPQRTIRVVQGDHLRQGLSRSCGCLKRELAAERMRQKHDLTGRVFGRLTVIAEAGRYGKPGQTKRIWLCECACAAKNQVEVLASNLLKGTSRSCGCLQRERCQAMGRARKGISRFPPGIRALRVTISRYRHRARKENRLWALSDAECYELMQQPCHYCGRPPEQVCHPEGADPVRYTGLDRVDNGLGYVPGNVVPCCGWCNWVKRDLSRAEFTATVKVLYHHMVAEGGSAAELSENRGHRGPE